jgi:hypothetical protein
MLDVINLKAAALSERLYELIINSMAPTRAMRLASMLALADCAALVIESCGEMSDRIETYFHDRVRSNIAQHRLAKGRRDWRPSRIQ